MADYALVKSPSGQVEGLWLRNPEQAKDQGLLVALLMKEGLPMDLLTGGYSVVPNKVDNLGGCFLRFKLGRDINTGVLEHKKTGLHILLDKQTDLIGMVVSVYNESSPVGYGYDQQWYEPLLREKVLGHHNITLDEDSGRLHMDYVNGRRCKCWVSNWIFNSPEYDEAHGIGSAEKLVSQLKPRKSRKEIILTGLSIEEAKQKIKESIPKGSLIIKETIINDGNVRTIECTDKTSSGALEKARMSIPQQMEIVDEAVLETKTIQTINVSESDEEMAKKSHKIPASAMIESVTILYRGKKGFLGIGKEANTYQIQYSLPAKLARVSFRKPAQIQIICELEEDADI